jgi:hypothetical protein
MLKIKELIRNKLYWKNNYIDDYLRRKSLLPLIRVIKKSIDEKSIETQNGII